MGIPEARVPKREKTPKTPKRGDPGGDRGNPKNQETGYQKGGEKGGPKTRNPEGYKTRKRGIPEDKGGQGGTGGDPGKTTKNPKSYHKTRVFGLRQFGGDNSCFKGCFKGGEIKAEIGGGKNVKNPKTPKTPKNEGLGSSKSQMPTPKTTNPTKAKFRDPRKAKFQSLTSSPILDHERSKDCDTGGTVVPSDREKGTDSYLARTLVYELLRTSSLLRRPRNARKKDTRINEEIDLDLQDLPVAVPHKPLCLVHLLGSIPDPSEALPDLLCPTPSPPPPPSPPPLYINAKNRKKDVSEGWGIKPVLIGKSHRQPDRPLFFRTKW